MSNNIDGNDEFSGQKDKFNPEVSPHCFEEEKKDMLEPNGESDIDLDINFS